MNAQNHYEPVVIDKNYLDSLIRNSIADVLPQLFEQYIKKDPKLLRIKEAAQHFHVSQPTIYRWIEIGDLKSQKFGNTLYVKLD